ncbi:MAG: ornithine cyclodeaminase family protein, partial [Pseudomonadota bacterium]
LVCPDFAAQAQREGECQQLDGKAHGPELYELVQSAPRFSEARNRLTVFDSTGWALEDHVAATILTDLARDTGCGTWIDMAAASDDPRDPYGFAASIQEAAAYTRKRSA